MKFVVILGVFLVFSQVKCAPLTEGEMSAITCISSHNLQTYAEKIAILLTQDKAPVDDKKLNKFMACHWKNKGLLDEEGNVNSDNLKLYLEEIFSNGAVVTETHKEIAQSIVAQCGHFKSKNPGQNAIMVQNCIAAYLSYYYDV